MCGWGGWVDSEGLGDRMDLNWNGLIGEGGS